MNHNREYVYLFENFGNEVVGDRDVLRTLWGGKGANLIQMTCLGVPVPAGFTISTKVYSDYMLKKTISDMIRRDIKHCLNVMTRQTGKRFAKTGSGKILLLSVRSGAPVSMPGMMETILNLGLTRDTVCEFAKEVGEKCAYESYWRFLQMYSRIVLGFPEVEEQKARMQSQIPKEKPIWELGVEELKRFSFALKERIQFFCPDFDEEPEIQLFHAIEAVFRSWLLPRAKVYRQLNNIPETMGTAVNVMEMVFGNMGKDSATGVVFSRNPSSGKKELYGEFLIDTQGEDIVAGVRTPRPIAELKKYFPQCYQDLLYWSQKLESYHKDTQDIEFTIEQGKLWILQCRKAKRTERAGFNIAMNMLEEGLLTREEAIVLAPLELNQVLKTMFDESDKQNVLQQGALLSRGLPAGPGAYVGYVAFTAKKAVEYCKEGKPTVLMRMETNPEDIEGLIASGAVVTARGGMTAHATLVSRQLGKVCVVGCSNLFVDEIARCAFSGKHRVNEGDIISVDGNSGEVILGKIQELPSEVLQVLTGKITKKESLIYNEYERFMQHVDEIRKLKVYVNADCMEECLLGLALGAEGVGLCRTEHMFFGKDRIEEFRTMILVSDKKKKSKALEILQQYQTKDFYDILNVMNEKPVVIRLLDPPLHEFLPQKVDEIKILAKKMGLSSEEVQKKIHSMNEVNPMLGLRGCRLGIIHPEITQMQIASIFDAACRLKQEGKNPLPHIMIPFVGDVVELEVQKKIVVNVAQLTFDKRKTMVQYKVGVMMELPRACLTADKIAKHADFFSFGTNDLTQTVFGISRDDSSVFTQEYLNLQLWKKDPFVCLDQEGVGELMHMAICKGKQSNPNLISSICGEHGGEALSVMFCNGLGLDYVTCSPFRIPTARLAAARAILSKQ